jgi:DNA ligase-1
MKPMLAATPESLLHLRYPVLASPKLDGIRCVVVDGVPLTRKLLGIPNRHIAKTIADAGLPALDGEITLRDIDGRKATFQEISSAVMSVNGTPDFEYHVFDSFETPRASFRDRHGVVVVFVTGAKLPWLKVVPHTELTGPEQLVAFEQKAVDTDGYEGIMLRSVTGLYKFGRSTANEGWLLKVKRFTQEEAEVVGFEELQENTNSATTDNLGHTKRSTHKSGMRGLKALGALTVRNAHGIFNVGTGFDAAQRDALWQVRETLVGRTVTFKYNAAGMKDVPRFPVFIGFRDPADMS